MLLEREYFSAGRYKLLETDILEYDLSLPAPYHGFRGNRPRIPPTTYLVRSRTPHTLPDLRPLLYGIRHARRTANGDWYVVLNRHVVRFSSSVLSITD